MQKFFLIDGNAYIHRAYHALPPLLTSIGQQVNAVYGFIRMILKILKNEKPDYLAICFDFPGKTFRHNVFEKYKATRKEIDDELKSQIPIAKELVQAFGFTCFEKEGFEADDLIATIVKMVEKSGIKTIIVTGDKDALQLVNENISVLNEHKNILYTPEKVIERYGVLPTQLVDVFALAGDSIDNIPGVPGIGEKTAIKLIKEFGNLENLFKNVDRIKGKLSEKIKNNTEFALLSKNLVTLNTSVDIDFSLEMCKIPDIDIEKVVPLLKKFEFNTLLNEIITINEITLLEEFDYKTVFTKDSLNEMKENLMKSSKVSVDLETTGLDPFDCKIVGIAFSNQPNKAWYIPVGHKYLNAPEQLSIDEVIPVLKSIFENPDIKICGHNIKFDLEVLKRYKIEIENIWFDTMVASYCLNPSRKSHSLKNLSIEFLNKSMTSIEKLIGKGKKQISMADVDINSVAKYSCQDADYTLQLANIFEPLLHEKKLEKLFFDVEMPLIEVIIDMEKTGMKLDVEYLEV
ncbi:MAG: 5'-3' exonuclease H3TH domain-containing protein, partial [Endomicrobiia bacterium]